MNDSNILALRLRGVTKDLGEFSVARLLPDKRRQRVGPFIFFDHIGPADFAPGEGINVRAHPHIGLATITYLFEGTMLHRDSLGYVQEIQPGAVNWMTAGKGIVHSEKVSAEVLASGQRLHGLQTWVALPEQAEEIEPRFEHYAAEDIPAVEADGARIRVVVGCAYDAESPVRTESDTLYIEVRLDAGASINLPHAQELAVFLVEGEATVAGEPLVQGELAVLANDVRVPVRATSDAHFMVCGGATIPGDRILWWNFVNSSRERIEQAKRDWREGRFPEVPGERDFIPLPDN